MDELIKNINDLTKEIRTLTAVVSALLQREVISVVSDESDEPIQRTYLDGTPIA